MQNLDLSKTVDAWSSLADTVFVPHTEAEYKRLVTLLNRLVDEVGEFFFPILHLTKPQAELSLNPCPMPCRPASRATVRAPWKRLPENAEM